MDIASVAAITIICYLIGEGAKLAPIDNKWVPVICGLAGGMLGIAGMFIMPPLGLFLCPFLGAFIGELLWDKTTPTHQALRVAFGSFVAFLLGTGAKLIVAVWMLVDILKAII